MTPIQPTVDALYITLNENFSLQTANPKGIKNKYAAETTELKDQATFITDEAYFYFLSQFGDTIISFNDGDISMFGFGYWEGMAITDYPLVDSEGMYVLADYADSGAAMLFFAYNSNDKEKPNRIWVSNDLDSGFQPVYDDFLHLLKSITSGAFEHDKYKWLNSKK